VVGGVQLHLKTEDARRAFLIHGRKRRQKARLAFELIGSQQVDQETHEP